MQALRKLVVLDAVRMEIQIYKKINVERKNRDLKHKLTASSETTKQEKELKN